MMRKYFLKYALLLVLLLGFGKAVKAQKIFIDENISYWNNVYSDVHINHTVFADVDSIFFIVEFTFNNDRVFDEYFYVYELHESYHKLNIADSDTLDIKDYIVAINANKIFTRFVLARDNKTDLAVIRITDKRSGIDYAYDIPLIEDYNFSTDGLVFYDDKGLNPVLQSFMNQGEAITVRSIDAFEGPVYCYYYSRDFEAAVPPMITDSKSKGKSLNIDSVFSIPINERIVLRRPGLYFFQKDSSSSDGISMRVQDANFPLVREFEEVLPPLIYISTRSETTSIQESPNPQQAFDNYWMELVKIPDLASTTVNRFYTRVEEANYLFTSFKEGWKSDMGMIYIIYGPPTDIYKSEEIVDWVYTQNLNMPNIRFSFYKVKNIFTDHHYTLLRKKSYDKNWFKSVELWRDGKK